MVPAARASSQPEKAIMSTTDRAVTMAATHKLSQVAPDTDPSIQYSTDCAARGSELRKTRKLASAENAAESTTPESTSRSGVMPPWAMEMRYTRPAAPNAPTKAPRVSR